jgi:hypothetical protein
MELEQHTDSGSDDSTCYASSRRELSGGGMLALLAMSGMIGMGFPRMRGSRSAKSVRNDPDREKTPDDIRKLEAARLKRERKAAKHSRHNV